MQTSDRYYEKLPRVRAFDQLTEQAQYSPLPDGWLIGASDIVNSTGLVAAGRYKTVNMVGAAVISALMNALEGRAFPFVFGGDGAGFAIPPQEADAARDALARVARWSITEFGIEMRVALVPLEDARAAGSDVLVARFQASDGVDYAMFDGGGLVWAEGRMKAGDYLIPPAAEGALPDLTGLSCRWSHMPARNGTILSLIASPLPDATTHEITAVYAQIIALTKRLERGGHPSPAAGPGSDWPPKGAKLEAHAAHGAGSIFGAQAKALFESFVAWALIRTGITLGGFDARRYARVVGDNADFRKLDDGLKMTLDCDEQTLEKIKTVLDNAAQNGVLRYGITTQDEAMMTCIVPSIMEDNHVHFIDGAAGGYTQAATYMKNR
ncbi:MAG: DUF3095 domain-containing protein [Sulfitobacter sp.]